MLRLSNAALLGALLTLPAVVGGQGAGAAEPGDGQRGLQLARQVCSSCHAVEAREGLSPGCRRCRRHPPSTKSPTVRGSPAWA